MSRHAERAAEWIYKGVWGVLASWFNVPQEAPTLPSVHGEEIRSLKPSRQYLQYRKLYFWVGLTLFDALLTLGWIGIMVANPIVGAILFPIYLVVAVVPDIIAYVAIHLRYDTTWYVLSERSMRIRRGIWIIHETTITYENIQNVGIHQGPIERYYGIATLTVKTAGGGGGGGKGEHSGMAGAHVGIIEGITDAKELRDAIMTKVDRSRSAGLGDERHPSPVAAPIDGIVLGTEHVKVLAEIRELVRGSAA
jgi:membrane protein YdbS with pleckstrin-like domain